MGAGFAVERTRYLSDALKPARLTRVVDIGANPLGDTPYKGLLDHGFCDVWGFEPNKTAYDALVAAKGPHEHYLPHAIGDGGTAEFKICRHSGFSSLLTPNRHTLDGLGRWHDATAITQRVMVETSRLDDIADLPEFDLLKIDIQGGELDVFKSGTQKLRRAIAIISEVAMIPLYVGQPLIDAQMSFLRSIGFEFHRFSEIHPQAFLSKFGHRIRMRPYQSQWVDADAVFVRSVLALRDLDTEQLKHLAILSDGVFASQDLTLAILAVLVERGCLDAAVVHGFADQLPHAIAMEQAKA